MTRAITTKSAILLALCGALGSAPAIAQDGLASGASGKAKQAEDAATNEDAVNPFTGKGLVYEDLEGQLKKASIEAQIEQAQYKTARFRKQKEQLAGAAGQGQGGQQNSEASQLKQRLASVQSRMEGMERKFSDLKEAKQASQASRQTAPPERHVPKPKLVAIVDDNEPGVQGLMLYDNETKTVKVGDHVGPYSVKQLGRESAVLYGKNGRIDLQLASGPGHIPSEGGSSGVRNLGGGTGSTRNVDSDLRSQAQQLSRRASR